MNLKIGVIKGDGIGPEIVTEAMKVLDKVGEVYGHTMDYDQLLMGGASIDVHGIPLTDETLEEATTLPFTGGKRMVDVEKVRDIMDDIRLSMPQEIKQARAIVEDRGRIVDDANKEAEAIIKRAEERARAIVAEQAIVKAAQQKATEMLASAQAQSREMRATVTGYCENMLRRTEEQLAQSLTDVKTVRTTLRQNSKKGLGEKRQPRGEG